jgi:hypothetical protein
MGVFSLLPHRINFCVIMVTSMRDYSHTLLEQEKEHFYSCVTDVVNAFKTHGVAEILHEVSKNTDINQELRVLFPSNNKA